MGRSRFEPHRPGRTSADATLHARLWPLAFIFSGSRDWRSEGISTIFSRQICSSGNENELATSKGDLTLPGLGSLRKRHRFSFDRAAACSGVCEYFCEGLRFLLVGQ